MKDHSDTATGDNAGKKFKEYNDVLSEIESSLHSAAKLQKKSNEATYVALGKALELGRIFHDLADDYAALKEYLQYKEQPWTAKSDSNFFHGIVTVAFDVIDPNNSVSITAAPQLSKYRLILKYAFERAMSGDDLVAMLSEKSINEVYELAAERSRFDPFAEFSENLDQRFARAQDILLGNGKDDSLPSGHFTRAMQRPISKTGFIPAMIKVDEDGFKLVKLYEDVPDQKIQEDVAALAPAEAKLARKLLAEQPGYSLFVACDIYTRFLPKIATVEDWERAINASKRPVLTENSTDADIANYMAWWHANRSETKPFGDDGTQEERDAQAIQMARKFILLDALRLRQKQDGWHGNSITTQPFSPSISVQFDRPRTMGHIQGALSVTSRIAAQFVDQFPLRTPWSVVGKARGLAIRSDDGLSVFPSSDLDGATDWLGLDPSLTVLASYELNKPMLQDLHRWKADFAALGLHGRSTFHRYHLLCVENDTLELALPDRDTHRRALGQLTSNRQISVPSGQRFVDFQMVRKLIQLTMDYGATYHIDLLEGHQGLTALKLHIQGLPIEISVTVPLMLSQKGNPVEINFPRPGQ